MNKFESEIEIIVFNRFNEALINTDLVIRSQDSWKTAISLRRFDIVVDPEKLYFMH